MNDVTLIVTQACGMTTASLTIISQGIAVEINAIVFCSIGGVAGVITGQLGSGSMM